MDCHSITLSVRYLEEPTPASTLSKRFWGESDPEHSKMSARTAKEAMWSTLRTKAAVARG